MASLGNNSLINHVIGYSGVRAVVDRDGQGAEHYSPIGRQWFHQVRPINPVSQVLGERCDILKGAQEKSRPEET